MNRKLELLFITNEIRSARIAEESGVDIIFLDLETLGKEKRQKNRNTFISSHKIDDVKKISNCLSKSKLLVRINPINKNTENEINKVIEFGADMIMLPMFKSISEVNLFIEYIDNRVETVLLLETSLALLRLEEIIKIPGIDRVHIGLNDLSIDYNLGFMFEFLKYSIFENASKLITNSDIKFGFGGIDRIGRGRLESEKILAEHFRLNSSMVILSRSFISSKERKNLNEDIFKKEVKKIRNLWKEYFLKNEMFFENNRIDLINKIDEITDKYE